MKTGLTLNADTGTAGNQATAAAMAPEITATLPPGTAAAAAVPVAPGAQAGSADAAIPAAEGAAVPAPASAVAATQLAPVAEISPADPAELPTMPLQEYMQLADQQLLQEPEDPTAEKPPIFTSGLIAMQHDYIANRMARETYGVAVPEAEQARTVIESIRFIDTLAPMEWYPRRRLAQRDPPLPGRSALVRCSFMSHRMYAI